MDTKEIELKWKQVEAKLQESSKELYGNKGWKVNSEPLHKGAKVETGKDGAEGAAEEFDASKKMDSAPANKNKEGAEEAAEEFKGEKKAAGHDGIDRKEGAAGGAEISKKGYGANSFRAKVRGVFGLSVDDKLNKPNMGKQGLSESEKKVVEGMWVPGDEYDDEGNRRNPATGRGVDGYRPRRGGWKPPTTPSTPATSADPNTAVDPLQAEAEKFAANIARKKGKQVTPELVAWALKALKSKGGISEELFLELVSVA